MYLAKLWQPKEKGCLHSPIFKGPDYIMNINSGWNFSSAQQAVASETNPLLSHCWLHGEGSSPECQSAWAENPSPVCPATWSLNIWKISCNWNRISARAKKQAWACAVRDFVFKETRCLLLWRRSDFGGIKVTKKRILFLSNWEAQMEYKNTNFSADKG